MSITSTIRALSKRIMVGGSAYFDCPNCGRKKKLGVTKYADKLIYQCFSASCGIRGALTIAPTKEALTSIFNKKPLEEVSTFRLPDHLIDGFASEDSVKMALKYNLMSAYRDGAFKTAYDPRLNRQVFFHTNSTGDVVGAMGRALDNRTFPKAYIYPNSEKTLWIIGKNLVADYPVAVIVEDILSAVQIYNCGYTGIALSGTTITESYISQLKGFHKIIIALDKDASIKSLKIKKLLDFYCNNVVILLLEKDFKDTPVEDAKKSILKVL